MVAGGAFQNPAGIVDLAQNEIPRIPAALQLAVGNAVLRLTEQDVAVLLAHSPRKKLSVRAEKAHVNARFCTLAHQSGRGPGPAETDDALQGVERHPADLDFLAADHNVFAVQRKIRILAGNIEGVQQLSHGVSSVCTSSRWNRR